MTLEPAPLVRTQELTVSKIDAVVVGAFYPRQGRGDTDTHTETGPDSEALTGLRPDPMRRAIVQVFAHYCAVLADRLNRTPEAHLQAFVDMLGGSPEPVVPAYAPLTFKAARASATAPTPIVPRFTEVAAPPAGSDTEPVVFQTVDDLEVLRAGFARAFAVDFQRGVIADASGVISVEGLPAGATIFSRTEPLVRSFYIGSRALFGAPHLASVCVQVELGDLGAMPGGAAVEWGVVTPTGFVALAVLRDTTEGFTRAGEIAFRAPDKWPAVSIHQVESCWLACRLRAAASILATATGPSPITITRLRLSVERVMDATPLSAAFFGRMPLDITRDFYPFGERPRFGDVFYLASSGFAVGRAQVTLQIKLTNPADGAVESSPIPPAGREGDPRVQWELLTRDGWLPLATEDTTRALTSDGVVNFTLPDSAAIVTLNNKESGWLRARLVSGSYGAGHRVIGNALIPTDAPPSIATVHASMLLRAGPVEPEQLIVDTGLEQQCFDLSAIPSMPAFCPLPAYDLNGRGLYLGLQADAAQLKKRALNLYVDLAPGDGPAVCRNDARATLAPRWQVRGANGWRDRPVTDGTGRLSHSGFVSFNLGNDIASWPATVLDPGRTLLWLRLILDGSDGSDASNGSNGSNGSNAPDAAHPPPAADDSNAADMPGESTTANTSAFSAIPALRQIVLNVVPAMQAIRLECELLGSGNGRPAQSFRTARKPVVGEVCLEVREGTQGGPRDWVRWNNVDDFTESDKDSRDFVMDRMSGTVRFGEAGRGRMPPPGGNNLRISYSAGGGARGNRPAGTITQLHTTIPYVESVTNCAAASGGQDVQNDRSLRRSALARLRHRDRAICTDDYADLALRSSPEVARAECRSARDLARTDMAGQAVPGVVSIVILPYGEVPEPQPSNALLARAKAYLEARCAAGVDIVLLGPTYLRVGVDAELVVRAGVSPARVAADCEQRVSAFLHPVTGGADGCGYGFGQEPHVSDLLAALDGVEGIDHMGALWLRFDAQVPGVRERGDFLVCSGRHTIRASQ